MPPGMYRYLVSAMDQEGKPVKVEGRARSLTVTGVRMEEGQAKLLVGDSAIDPSWSLNCDNKKEEELYPWEFCRRFLRASAG